MRHRVSELQAFEYENLPLQGVEQQGARVQGVQAQNVLCIHSTCGCCEQRLVKARSVQAEDCRAFSSDVVVQIPSDLSIKNIVPCCDLVWTKIESR